MLEITHLLLLLLELLLLTILTIRFTVDERNPKRLKIWYGSCLQPRADSVGLDLEKRYNSYQSTILATLGILLPAQGRAKIYLIFSV